MVIDQYSSFRVAWGGRKPLRTGGGRGREAGSYQPGKGPIYIIYIYLWEIVPNAVGKCSIHMSVERNTIQND